MAMVALTGVFGGMSAVSERPLHPRGPCRNSQGTKLGTELRLQLPGTDASFVCSFVRAENGSAVEGLAIGASRLFNVPMWLQPILDNPDTISVSGQ